LIILITSHANLADGLVSAFEMIAGHKNYIQALSLNTSGVNEFRRRLLAFLNNAPSPVLILADVKGGTPYNEAYKYYLAHSNKCSLVSGVNLPMLLEIGTNIENCTDLDDVKAKTKAIGQQGIEIAEDIVEDNDDLDF
jgi:PTS system mannose-specific IIA component/PTS system mannose-specific IIB component